MALEEFADMMPHTVNFEPLESTDVYGNPGYGALIPVQSRVVYEDVKTTNEDGQDIVASGHIYLMGVFGITVKHRLTLPDGTQRPIVRVRRYPDENGAHHEVVIFA